MSKWIVYDDLENEINTDKPFIIKGNTIYVAYNFNESFVQCKKYMTNIEVLIFSENISKYKYSFFNRQIVLTPSLTHVTFGYCFNQQIVLTSCLTHVTFGYEFNQQIVLTQRLTHVTFGFRFNQKIVLTPRLIHVTFGYCFNQQIVLTPRLKHVTFGGCFNQPIVLTPHLTHVEFGYCFNQQIILTQRLTNIKIVCNNYKLIDNLPNTVKCINIMYYFNLPLNNIPSSVTKIIVDNEDYKFKYLIKHLT